MDLKTWVRESPSYQALLLQRAQAEATWEAAQKGLAPTLTPQGNYSRSLLGQESLALGLGGSMALPWGQAQDNLRGAEITYKKALLDLLSQGNLLFQTALSQYLDTYLAALDQALAQKRLAWREAQLKAVRDQREKGQATFQDLLDAEGNLAEAQAEALRAQLALSLAQARLQATLGRAVAVEALPPLPQETLSLERVLTFLEERPDVQKARLALEEAEEALAQARRERAWPEVSVSLTAQEGNAALSLGLNLKTGVLNYGAQYTVLGTGGNGGVAFQVQAGIPLLSPVQDAGVALQEKALAQARLALESARRAAELDLRAKYQALLQAQAQVEVAAKALAGAENSLAVAQKRLEAGTGTVLEVMQAEVGLLQARRTLEGAKAALLQAYYALWDAMGQDLVGGER
jgi:outer membrane protein